MNDLKMNINDVAKAVNRTVRQVRRWHSKKLLHGSIGNDGKVYFNRDEVEKIRIFLQGLTIEQVSKKLGVSTVTLWNWDNGDNPNQLHHSYIFNGKKYYSFADVDQYIKSHVRLEAN